MVWIHGGAFESGGTVDPMFDCHNFVKKNPDVIVVTIAYRLGVFRFLHLSHLSDGEDYSDNVTIFGESVGSGSCTLLPLIKGSQKYFKCVIAQSGAPNQTRSTEKSIDCTNELMEILDCKTVADLQKVEAQKLLESSTVLLMRQFS